MLKEYAEDSYYAVFNNSYQFADTYFNVNCWQRDGLRRKFEHVNSNVTSVSKKPHPATTKCDKSNKMVKNKYLQFLTVKILTKLDRITCSCIQINVMSMS